MSEITPEEQEILYAERKDREGIKNFVPPLIASEGWDIIRSYGEVRKAQLLVELINNTTDELKKLGKSHDSLTGEIKGIVTMLHSPETMLHHADEFKEDDIDEDNDNEQPE